MECLCTGLLLCLLMLLLLLWCCCQLGRPLATPPDLRVAPRLILQLPTTSLSHTAGTRGFQALSVILEPTTNKENIICYINIILLQYWTQHEKLECAK